MILASGMTRLPRDRLLVTLTPRFGRSASTNSRVSFRKNELEKFLASFSPTFLSE